MPLRRFFNFSQILVLLGLMTSCAEATSKSVDKAVGFLPNEIDSFGAFIGAVFVFSIIGFIVNIITEFFGFGSAVIGSIVALVIVVINSNYSFLQISGILVFGFIVQICISYIFVYMMKVFKN